VAVKVLFIPCPSHLCTETSQREIETIKRALIVLFSLTKQRMRKRIAMRGYILACLKIITRTHRVSPLMVSTFIHSRLPKKLTGPLKIRNPLNLTLQREVIARL
jgi:hypothetical protein